MCFFKEEELIKFALLIAHQSFSNYVFCAFPFDMVLCNESQNGHFENEIYTVAPILLSPPTKDHTLIRPDFRCN